MKSLAVRIFIIAMVAIVLVAATVYICALIKEDVSLPASFRDLQIVFAGDKDSDEARALSRLTVVWSLTGELELDQKDALLIIDSKDRDWDYASLAAMAQDNRVVLLNVTSTRQIMKEVFDEDSYELFLPLYSGEKQLIRICRSDTGQLFLKSVVYDGRDQKSFIAALVLLEDWSGGAEH